MERDYPLVKESHDVQDRQTKFLKQRARMYDDIAEMNSDTDYIPVERVDKEIPRNTTERFELDSMYKGPRDSNGGYNRHYLNEARAQISQKQTAISEPLNKKLRRVLTNDNVAES